MRKRKTKTTKNSNTATATVTIINPNQISNSSNIIPTTISVDNPIDNNENNSSGESDIEFELSLDPTYTPPSDISESSVEDLTPTVQPITNWSNTNSILGNLVNSSPWPLDELLRSIVSLIHQLFIESVNMVLNLSTWWSGGESSLARDEVIPLDSTKKIKRRRRKIESEQNGHVYQTSNDHFPGMVNLSGTLCYMNSVLQAFASITSLVNHLDKIVELAVETDTLTPVTDALLDVIQQLNTPHSRTPPALRPHNLLEALYPLPQIRRLLSTREQQDAHELFIVLAEAISDESIKVVNEISKLRGLGEILSLQNYTSEKNSTSTEKLLIRGKADLEGSEKRKKIRGISQPWEGLMARRRVCQKCGWETEVRMDLVGGMELPIPLHGDVTLDSCIAEYLSPEYLSDVTCEACSLRHTLAYYQSEVERLSSAPSATSSKTHKTEKASAASGSFSALEGLSTIPSSQNSTSDEKITNSRKKRASQARRVETKLKEMLDSNVISNFNEPYLQPKPDAEGLAPIPIKWQLSKTNSIRQSILTRSPKSLRLLFIRSEFTPYGSVLKKTARVNFPIILNLTRFISNDIWKDENLNDSIPNGFISQSNKVNGELPEIPKTQIKQNVLYRLESVILHYGYTHSSGHFICIRRKPSPSSNKKGYRPKRINKSCSDECNCESCLYFGKVRDENLENKLPNKGWLRISDDDVEEVGEEALFESRGSVFMLFYEKVGEYQGGGGKSEIKENGRLDMEDLNNASQVI